MNIQGFYKYSWFSTLAYVDWRKASGLTAQESIEDAASAERVPGEGTKGVSFAFFLEPPCHVAHALS